MKNNYIKTKFPTIKKNKEGSMDRAKNIYELFKNNDILENITSKDIENYIEFADQLFGDGMGRRFVELAGEKVRKRQDGTRSRVMAVPSTNILLDITMTSFAIIFNTTNEFITGINILLFAGFTQVGSGLIYVDRLRRISYTIVITPTGGDMVVVIKGLKGQDSLMVPGVLYAQKFQGLPIVAGTAGYCGGKTPMPDCLIPEETHVYNPGSVVADRHLLAFYGEGTGQEYYRTGFMPDTFRVKSDNLSENLMISDNMKPLYTILEQIGDDLGFTSTRGPLFSSRYKLELFSSQRSNLRDSGFVAVDMETAFM